MNIKNEDDECFKWCILRYLYLKEIHPEKIYDLKFVEHKLLTFKIFKILVSL